jgi:hypothetical protein
MYTHQGTLPPDKGPDKAIAEQRYPKEFKHSKARDTMSSDHSARAILKGKPIILLRLLDTKWCSRWESRKTFFGLRKRIQAKRQSDGICGVTQEPQDQAGNEQ